MRSHTHILAFKRWLPLLVLLVVLAQLSSVSHWHADNESMVDCSLHHAGSHGLHTGHSIIGFPPQEASPPIHFTPILYTFTSCGKASIRAPPVLSLS